MFPCQEAYNRANSSLMTRAQSAALEDCARIDPFSSVMGTEVDVPDLQGRMHVAPLGGSFVTDHHEHGGVSGPAFAPTDGEADEEAGHDDLDDKVPVDAVAPPLLSTEPKACPLGAVSYAPSGHGFLGDGKGGAKVNRRPPAIPSADWMKKSPKRTP